MEYQDAKPAGFEMPANYIDLTEDTPIELCFLTRIRPERRFESPEALKAQILRDVAHARRYLRLANSISLT